jgi:DNA modification methylase
VKVELIKIDELSLDPNNARKHDDKNLKAIADSLTQFGQRKPIVLHGKTVVAGNGTMVAARSLGWTHIAAVYVPESWTPDQVKAYALADNRSAELAVWDELVLASQLLELHEAEFDIELLGFELPADELDEVVEDEIPEEVEPKSKLGDVWQLGRHRLMCGDSVKAEDVTRLMNGELADCIFTDPPWNVNYGDIKEGNIQNYKPRKILNDNLGDQFGSFCDQFSIQLKTHSKAGALIYMVMSAQEWPVIHKSLEDAGFHWSSTIIWAKDQLVLSRKDYHTQYEPIWYGWSEGAGRLQPVVDRKQTDVWNIARPKVSELHPTTKPIELIARAIENSSKQKDSILDLFGGSGSTLIAAETLNRTCYMMELDPKYVDVIIARWEKLTGKTAELIEG